MNSIQTINVQLVKEDYQTLEKIGKLTNRKNEDIAKTMLETMINWIGKQIIAKLKEQKIETTLSPSPESKYNIRFIIFHQNAKKFTVYGKITITVNILFNFETAETPENIKNELINTFNTWCRDDFGSNEILKLDLEVSPNK